MIDIQTVHKVANLARLELTPEEEQQFSGQLSSILEYFEQLSELDTKNIEPTTRAIDLSNITRSDLLKPYSDREALLQQAPAQDGDFFEVPQILSTDEA
jgi:aspartyl-tRNA(Asn)/glutamyl-tRNA(Gln) amidotransferase subunit C